MVPPDSMVKAKTIAHQRDRLQGAWGISPHGLDKGGDDMDIDQVEEEEQAGNESLTSKMTNLVASVAELWGQVRKEGPERKFGEFPRQRSVRGNLLQLRQEGPFSKRVPRGKEERIVLVT